MRSLNISGENLHNAYILEGPDEELYSLVREFAESLVSKDGGLSENRKANIRLRIRKGSAPDIITVMPDKPEKNPDYISVSNIRSNINDTVYIKPYEMSRKIYIIRHAGKMNIQAQNALLKTLEEPPEYVSIFLITDNKKYFLPTVLSRCTDLTGNRGEDPEDIFEKDLYGKLLDLIKTDMPLYLLRDLLSDGDLKEEEIFSSFEGIFRDILTLKLTGDRKRLFSSGERLSAIEELSEKFSLSGIGSITDVLKNKRISSFFNANTELSCEEIWFEIRNGKIHSGGKND